MLPRQHRIQSGSDFRVIMRTGKRASARAFVIYAVPAQASVSRFGFVVSKAVGSAVTRNLVKRRLRAIAGRHLPLPKPLDVVIRANPAAASSDFATLATDFDKSLMQVLA